MRRSASALCALKAPKRSGSELGLGIDMVYHGWAQKEPYLIHSPRTFHLEVPCAWCPSFKYDSDRRWCLTHVAISVPVLLVPSFFQAAHFVVNPLGKRYASFNRTLAADDGPGLILDSIELSTTVSSKATAS